MNPAAVGIKDFETKLIDLDLLSPARQVPKRVSNYTSHCLKFFCTQASLKVFIKIINIGKRADRISSVIMFVYGAFFFKIVLILNIPYNLFQDIFNSHDAAHATILVINYRQMISLGEESVRSWVFNLWDASQTWDVSRFVVGRESVPRPTEKWYLFS